MCVPEQKQTEPRESHWVGLSLGARLVGGPGSAGFCRVSLAALCVATGAAVLKLVGLRTPLHFITQDHKGLLFTWAFIAIDMYHISN